MVGRFLGSDGGGHKNVVDGGGTQGVQVNEKTSDICKALQMYYMVASTTDSASKPEHSKAMF